MSCSASWSSFVLFYCLLLLLNEYNDDDDDDDDVHLELSYVGLIKRPFEQTSTLPL